MLLKVGPANEENLGEKVCFNRCHSENTELVQGSWKQNAGRAPGSAMVQGGLVSTTDLRGPSGTDHQPALVRCAWGHCWI